ncbi:hypothetical protein V6N13_064804 [Hibiscus sabdariffa]
MVLITLLLQFSSLMGNVCHSFTPSSNLLHQANPRASVGTSSYRPTVVRLSWTQKEGDTDLGAKTPKDVKITGIWYAQLDS